MIFRRYCNSHDRTCFNMLLVMHQVSLLYKALIADELNHACIFFAAVPGFRRLRKLAQKHLSACVNLCFMLVFVLPSVSSISPRICVFSACGMGAITLSAMYRIVCVCVVVEVVCG